MNSNKLWKKLYILSTIVFFTGIMTVYYFLVDTAPDGTIILTSRPWWLWVVAGMVVLSLFVSSLAEMRRRNNGQVTSETVVKTVLYLAVIAGVVWLLKYFTSN